MLVTNNQYEPLKTGIISQHDDKRLNMAEMEIKRPSYNRILSIYREAFKDAISDYKIKNEDGISNNVFSVDFSEIFLYMYSPQSRIDFRLVNYIFDNNHFCDFKFVLLPPAIFELRRHYQSLNNLCNCNYKYPEELADIMKKFNGLDKKYENIKPNQRDALLIQWKQNINKFKGFENIASLIIESRPKNIVESSHKRLMKLFKNNVVIGPNEVDFLEGKINMIGSNERKLETILGLLQRNRPNSSYLNNLIDAEHAAINHQINSELCGDDNFINIFTGSPVPLRIFKDELSINKNNHEISLGRCPIYLTLRTFCQKELAENTPFTEEEFLCGCYDIINDINISEEPDNLLKSVVSNYQSIADGDKNAFLINKNIYSMVLIDLFYKNEELKNYFDNAFNLGHFYSRGREALKKVLYNENTRVSLDEIRKVDELEKIAYTKEILEEQSKFEEGLEATQMIIKNNITELFKCYYELLEGYDYKKLSPQMQKYYNLMLTDPDQE